MIAEQLDRVYQSVVPPEVQERMRGALAVMFENIIRDSVNRLSVSEWAEQKRILPKGLTSMPGPFRWETTPYLREIADCFSESSPVQRVAIMKGSRVGATVGVGESWIGYVIDCAPGPMLYIGADKESAETAVEIRLDRMLASAGLMGKIFAQAEKAHNKKTGDTKSKKEFPGGFLMPIGPNVASKLRNFGVRYVFFDELDAYPQELQQEGDPVALAEKRTDEYEAIRKILYASTPLVEQTSRIKPLFEAGDQRYYYVPCKHCQVKQVLRWRDKDGAPRLKFETDDRGRLIRDSVHYECEACGKPWRNEDKANFLPRGEWRPTAEPSEPNFRSYHISALYSPIGMRSWESVCREFLKAKDSPPKLRVFVNTCLGETWVEKGEAPSFEKLLLRRDAYRAGTLPEGAEAFFLTAAADVQQDRLECEVLAWGRNKESWSVSYNILPANDEKLGTANPQADCWKALEALLIGEHAGLHVKIALIDEKHNTVAVRAFADKLENVYPCMGESRIGTPEKIVVLKQIEEHRKLQRVNIYAHSLKNELYGYLRQGPPPEGESFPPGYCHFPIDYSDRYFQQLTAEEFIKERTRAGTIKMGWRVIHGRRNEAHDCRIYGMAALLVYMGLAADEEFKRPITHAEFWDWAEAKRREETGGAVIMPEPRPQVDVQALGVQQLQQRAAQYGEKFTGTGR